MAGRGRSAIRFLPVVMQKPGIHGRQAAPHHCPQLEEIGFRAVLGMLRHVAHMVMRIGGSFGQQLIDRIAAEMPDFLDRTIRCMKAAGHEVLIQAGAGEGASIPDADYTAVEARIVSEDELYAQADVVLALQWDLAPAAVVTVAPGFVETAMARPYMTGEKADAIRNQSPLQRIATVEDVVAELVGEIGEEPDYAAALAALD